MPNQHNFINEIFFIYIKENKLSSLYLSLDLTGTRLKYNATQSTVARTPSQHKRGSNLLSHPISTAAQIQNLFQFLPLCGTQYEEDNVFVEFVSFLIFQYSDISTEVMLCFMENMFYYITCFCSQNKYCSYIILAWTKIYGNFN